MTYLFKMSKRLARVRSMGAIAALVSLACSSGDEKDFLSPDPNLIVPVLSAVRVSPAVATLKAGEVITFTASGVSVSGVTMDVVVDWSASGGTIQPDGRFTASESGQYRVKARARTNAQLADSARVGVWVRPTDVLNVVVSPGIDELPQGEGLQFQAEAELANGNSTVKEPLIWSATGGYVDGTGWFTATYPGTFMVTASASNGVKGAGRIVVHPKDRLLTGLRILPDTITVVPGQAMLFDVAGTWNDGSQLAPDVVWSSTGGTISKGMYTPGSQPGVWSVIARHKNGTLADTARVTITEPAVVRVDVTPGTVSLAPGAPQKFSATAKLSDSSSRAATVTWQANGGTITSAGDYTAGAVAGSYTVTASVPGTSVSGKATVAVTSTAATLTSVVVNPSSVTLASGLTQTFTVTALYSDGSTRTPAATWTATGGTVSSGGTYTAGSTPGTYRVIAAASGKADTSTITVAAPTLTGLVVSPSVASVSVGATQLFSVSGSWSNGGNTAPSVTWTATGGSISSSGSFSAGNDAGTFRVIATHTGGTLADTSLVTVSEPTPTLSKIVLSPASVSLAPGAALQFAVAGTLSNGSSTIPVVTYSATGGSISASGVYTAGTAAGTYHVIAKETGGAVADTSAVTISSSAPTLVSLTVTPGSTALQTASTRQFAATGNWSDGSTTPPAVAWTATGGTITTAGVYTAGSSAGTYRVIGKQVNGTKADTADVSVTLAATLTAIVMTPSSVSLTAGGTKQFAVSGTYSNGGSGVPAVTYAATGGTITSAGLYTAGTASGTFRVIATQQNGTLADTSFVTIGSVTPTMTGLVLIPGSVTLAPGVQQQFNAQGLYSNGTSTTVPVTWSATGGTITSTGIYSAGGIAGGSYRVIATHTTGKADTSAVSIMNAAPPGQYLTIASNDWKNYADKNALAGMFGVEGGMNTLAPALPVTAFYDLVPDALFGKAVRYNGGPTFNTTSTSTPGRIAVHGAGFTPTSNVWVRQFIRFSTNWFNGGANPGGGISYKVMFLRWEGAGFRHGFLINGLREVTMEWGQGSTGGVAGATDNPLPWDNHQPLCSRDGFGGGDAIDMVKVHTVCTTKTGKDGSGEWFEVIMHTKRASTYTGHASLAIRRYTTNGATTVQPGPWQIIARETSHPALSGNEIKPAKAYNMGVNRNKQWDEAMFIYWGPYEVVDGTKYPNPFGMPWQ